MNSFLTANRWNLYSPTARQAALDRYLISPAQASAEQGNRAFEEIFPENCLLGAVATLDIVKDGNAIQWTSDFELALSGLGIGANIALTSIAALHNSATWPFRWRNQAYMPVPDAGFFAEFTILGEERPAQEIQSTRMRGRTEIPSEARMIEEVINTRVAPELQKPQVLEYTDSTDRIIRGCILASDIMIDYLADYFVAQGGISYE